MGLTGAGTHPGDGGKADNMEAVWRKVKQAWTWLFGDEDTLADISAAFALFTVANSVMMVTGGDTPKTGTFAYVHLLIRLAIITFVFWLWDISGFVADMRRYWAALRRPTMPSRAALRGLFETAITYRFNAACLIYTGATIAVCLITIVFVANPQGGVPLYAGLVVGFPAIYGALFAASVLVPRRP